MEGWAYLLVERYDRIEGRIEGGDATTRLHQEDFAQESRDEAGVIVMIETWADQAALDAHTAAPAFTGLAAGSALC